MVNLLQYAIASVATIITGLTVISGKLTELWLLVEAFLTSYQQFKLRKRGEIENTRFIL